MSNSDQKKSLSFIEIKPTYPLFDLRIKEVLHYRYLLFLFVKRDFITIYKQTILGPLWHLLQPLLTTFIFTAIFSHFAKIKTDGPPTLFYLSGLIMWGYFAACINKTATTFISNAGVFGKVYFPRITVPLASVISNLLSLSMQLVLLVFFLLVYHDQVCIQYTILLLPVFILVLAFIGLGVGIIVSSLTIRYRDLAYLVTFGVQLWMYGSSVIIPLSVVPDRYKFLFKLNPVIPIIEGFRYSLFGKGAFLWIDFLYSIAFTVVVMLVGIILFNRTERNFMDTI